MISGRLFGSSVTPIRVGFVLCCIIAAGLIGCDRVDREPDVEFDPPPGTYASPQLVRLAVPAAEAVYVSIDGRDPDTSRCRSFDGSPIELNGSAEIKVVLVRDGIASPPFVGEYLIAGDEEAAGNAAMLEAWFEYEEATRRRLMDENNGGREPGLGQLGKRWILQDGKGGKIEWVTVAEGLRGRTTFTYEGYEFNGLRVRGVLIGRFDTKGNGAVRSQGGRPLVLTGTHSGTIDDQARLERKVRAAGYYSVTCSGEGCASGPTRHLAPAWKIASTAAINRGGSCDRGALRSVCARPALARHRSPQCRGDSFGAESNALHRRPWYERTRHERRHFRVPRQFAPALALAGEPEEGPNSRARAPLLPLRPGLGRERHRHERQLRTDQ
ncbi:MAG: chitobiase/beta-hexosaminidase C-terminal domain-containing protein [Deltaproteobacteria bacterium]|nr:chitobiase/beta-hexosaminidase C-terminal domain-containing protein [Deltaproteobacteria bacterium]